MTNDEARYRSVPYTMPKIRKPRKTFWIQTYRNLSDPIQRSKDMYRNLSEAFWIQRFYCKDTETFWTRKIRKPFRSIWLAPSFWRARISPAGGGHSYNTKMLTMDSQINIFLDIQQIVCTFEVEGVEGLAAGLSPPSSAAVWRRPWPMAALFLASGATTMKIELSSRR